MDIQALARAFHDAGKSLYLVGGTVRDELLGRRAHDIDCTTDALPEEIKLIAARTNPQGIVPIGEKFGTIRLLYVDEEVEITTYRSERYAPGSRKPEVRFGTSLRDDLQRRDFTINAIARDALTGVYSDPFDGRADLARGVIRAVAEPEQRFLDDPLRIMRAIRFVAQFGFTIEHETELAMLTHARAIQTISAERVRDELCKILLLERDVIPFLHATVFPYIAPEIQVMKPIKTPASLEVRLAALLLGTRPEPILRRLRFEHTILRRVTLLVEAYETLSTLADARARRHTLADCEEVLPELLLLLGSTEDVPVGPFESPLDGEALMQLFGRAPGAWIGEIKRYLRMLVIDGKLAYTDQESAKKEALRYASLA